MAIRRQAVLPAGPYRDSSDCAEGRVRHLDHSYSIPERPPGLMVMLPVAVLLVAVLVWLPIDPRPAIAAAVYLGPLLGGYLVTAVQYPPMGMAWWEVGPPLVIAIVTGALLAASAGRARHLSRL